MVQQVLEPVFTRCPTVRLVSEFTELDSPKISIDLRIEVEARLNLMAPAPPLTTLCLYPLPRLLGRTLLHVLQTHPVRIEDGQIVKNPYVSPEKFLKTFRSP